MRNDEISRGIYRHQPSPTIGELIHRIRDRGWPEVRKVGKVLTYAGLMMLMGGCLKGEPPPIYLPEPLDPNGTLVESNATQDGSTDTESSIKDSWTDTKTAEVVTTIADMVAKFLAEKTQIEKIREKTDLTPEDVAALFNQKHNDHVAALHLGSRQGAEGETIDFCIIYQTKFAVQFASFIEGLVHVLAGETVLFGSRSDIQEMKEASGCNDPGKIDLLVYIDGDRDSYNSPTLALLTVKVLRFNPESGSYEASVHFKLEIDEDSGALTFVEILPDGSDGKRTGVSGANIGLGLDFRPLHQWLKGHDGE